MLDTWLSCIQQIDNIKVHVKCTHVQTVCYSTARRIMVYLNSTHVPLFCTNYTRAFWFARAHMFFLPVPLACMLAWHIIIIIDLRIWAMLVDPS